MVPVRSDAPAELIRQSRLIRLFGSVNLPQVVDGYIRASNAHDVKSILACFSDDAVVRDEGETLRGKQAIGGWIAKTIEKYKFKFKPVSAQDRDGKTVVAVEVSGTFPGSPITLEYHFTISSDRIQSLTIG